MFYVFSKFVRIELQNIQIIIFLRHDITNFMGESLPNLDAFLDSSPGMIYTHYSYTKPLEA